MRIAHTKCVPEPTTRGHGRRRRCRAFKGNVAGWVSLSVKDDEAAEWTEVLPRTTLQPDTMHRLPLTVPATTIHARLDVCSEGGLARLRLHGSLTRPDPARPGAAALAARVTRRTRQD
ncbi:hypothetical protein ACIPY6_08400 [Streptomyces sp. NPDC090054]|uniref:hypothetical protein n=1 Tax=Streptomyces sp. NPDC090054 TaxID=3365933 RepID=UPI00382EB9F1